MQKVVISDEGVTRKQIDDFKVLVKDLYKKKLINKSDKTKSLKLIVKAKRGMQ